MFARSMFPLVVFDGGEPAGEAEPPAPPEPQEPAAPGPDAAFAEMRRKADEAERRAKAAEDKLAQEARKKAEAEGRFKEIADAEKARADALEATLEKSRQDAEVSAIATELKFRNPSDVLHRLTAEQRADAVQAREALEAIAKKDTYLVRGTNPPKPNIGQVLEPAAGGQAPKEDPRLAQGQRLLDAFTRAR